jgi:hypothetical protein
MTGASAMIEGGIHGVKPTSEIAPHFCGVIDGQVLQQPLSDAAELHVQVKGLHLSADGSAVGIAGPVQILVAVTPAQRLHSAHPEVLRIGAQYVHGLAESQLDPEPVAVEQEYFQRIEGEVGESRKMVPRWGWHTITKRTIRAAERQIRSRQR